MGERKERRGRRDHTPELESQLHGCSRDSGELALQKQRRPCPLAGWEYIDPRDEIRAPFGLEEMKRWYRAGYFKPDLAMRCDPGDGFRPFVELFQKGTVPFEGEVIVQGGGMQRWQDQRRECPLT